MPDPPQSPKASRNVYVFGSTSFLNDTASEMAYWILPAFLASIGAGPAQLGIIEGVAEAVASFAKLWSGNVTDRLPRRKPLVASGYILANAVKPLLALATSWFHVFAIRFTDRLAKGIRGAPRDVMLAESVPPQRLGAAFGLMQAMDSAGAIVGPLLALWIVQQWGMRGVFWAAAIPGALCVALFLLLAVETPHEQRAKSMPQARAALPRRYWYMLAAVLLFSLGNSSDMFLVLRAADVGIGAAAAPLLGLVFNVVFTAASWPAGHLGDRYPKAVIAAAGYVVFAITYVVFALAPSQAAIWITMGFYGLFYALTIPVLRALVIETVPTESRGRAMGIFYFSTSIAILLASLITGALWDAFGAAVPFYVSAGLATVAAALLLFGPRQAPARS